MGVLDLFRLDGKVAIVTGAGQGIGRAFALALADAGADIVIADVNEHSGQLVAKEVREQGGQCEFVKAEVGVEEDITRMIQTAVTQFGGLDILVNNANARFRDLDWMGVNLKAILQTCRAAAEEMKKRGRGKIVNIASISGTIANAGTEYCTGKAGVIHLTRCLAVELARYNITVNSISPSYTLSPARRQDDQAMRSLIRSLTPMGWYERPEDLCGTLIYLVSSASDYVTGRDIIVDGGHTLNVWLQPPPREFPPLVNPQQESLSLKHDLKVLGIPCDENGWAME